MIFRADKATALHRRFKPIVAGSLAAASLLVAACVSIPPRKAGIAKINPASLAAAPATYDGREVEIVGLVIWESGVFGLYQTYGAYCRGAQGAAIDVRWDQWPGVTPKDSRRRVMVRGVFRNRGGVTQADGSTAIAAGAPGPGPLEPGAVVRWLSNPERPCPNRQ